MSATTLNLPYTRFVAQVSTAPARSKSTYLALMEENLAALQKCPWKEAADVPAALADHDFTASTHLSSAYDAFKMTGNYSASTMTEIAYAGMAAYRFKIPDSALASGSEVALSSITLPVSRDRYLKSGLRVVAVLSDSATPSADWDVVRGSGGILLSAQLPQSAAYLLAGAPGKDTLEIDLSSVDSGNPSAYLWIYLTLEDYTEHWDMYSAKEQRLYAVEGSAMLVGGSAEFTFAGEVAPDTPPSAAQTRLITTSYPSTSVKYGSIASPTSFAARAHRVFASVGTNCFAVVGGENAITEGSECFGSWMPALAVRRLSSGTFTSDTVKFKLPNDYNFDSSSGTWPKDLASDWGSTPPGRALWRGIGVSGVAIAPMNGATDIYKPSSSGGSSSAVFKYFSVYVSTKEGCWRLGTFQIASNTNYAEFFPNVVQVAPGGDMLLLRKAASSYGTYNPAWVYEWFPECVSVDSGVIHVGDRVVPFEGTITGLGSYYGIGSARFLVAGDLVSVGGVPCRHVIMVDALNDPIVVRPLDIDALDLVPNVYDNFRIIYAGGAYFVLGDFTSLGGIACTHGAATVAADGGVTALDQYIVDIVGTGESTCAYILANRTAIEIR